MKGATSCSAKPASGPSGCWQIYEDASTPKQNISGDKYGPTPQQQLLIDSILRGFDLPKIFLRKLPDGTEKLFDVVDGVQRLTSIWRFLADEYRLPRTYSYPDLESVGGKRWSELSQDARDRLEFAKITVTELDTVQDDDIRELFQRLQQGEPLNAAERRNAIAGPVRDFVANELSSHSFWENTGLKNKRFSWDEMSAVVLALVRAGGPIGLKGADLIVLYEDTTFDPQGSDAELAISYLDRLSAVASLEVGAIRTRWSVVDLLLSLMHLDEEDIRPLPQEVVRFFLDFERERKEGAAELSDLRTTVIGLAADEIAQEELDLPSIKPDMLTYLNSFAREGATAANVETRAKVMTNRLRNRLQNES